MTRRPTDSENWGGQRPGSGARRQFAKLVNVSVMITPEQDDYLHTINSNRSNAIRRIIEHSMFRHGYVVGRDTVLHDTEQEG